MRARGALAIGALVAVLAVVATAVLLLRPPVRAMVGDVRVECAAAIGLDDAACAAWGERTLAEGPSSRTFEMSDVGRIALERGWLGLAGPCEARYFVRRYPDDPVWSEETACP